MSRTKILVLIAAAHVASSVIIDDADPRVQYSGLWVPYTDVNSTQYWSGTVTYTNVTGAVAALSFTGDSVRVSGAFPPVGSYNMHSEYSIDGGPPSEFRPPGDVEAGVYKRTFFTSGPLPYGPHTLTIKNLGEQFWLDSIAFEVPDMSSSGAATVLTTAASAASAADPSIIPFTNPITSSTVGTTSLTLGPGVAPTSGFILPSSGSIPSSSTSETSPHTSGPPSPISGSTPPPQSGSFSQTGTDPPPPTSTLPPAPLSSDVQPGAGDNRNGETRLPNAVSASIIAGAVVGGIILLFLLLLGWRMWQRRKRQQRSTLGVGGPGIDPFADRDADTRVMAGLGDAPASGDVPVTYGRSPSGKWPHALGSGLWESSASSLISPSETRATLQDSNGTEPLCNRIHQSSLRRSMVPRRRSLDGGFRLAGGFPGEEQDDIPDNALSTVSTLPPSYQVHRR